MTFRFRKYGRAGAVLLALCATACQRAPLFTTPVTTITKPEVPATLVTTGVSETLAVARRAIISGVAYNMNLTIPAQKTEPIEVVEQVSFNLRTYAKGVT